MYLCTLMRLVILFISCLLDTLALKPAVSVAVKPVQGTSISAIASEQLEQLGIDNPKSLSSLIPGIHLPDYGASLTSSIYVRGLGSRMENPVIGLDIDDLPVLDKNSYDLE